MRWKKKQSSIITSWRILSAKTERRSWNNTEAHFTNTINERANEFWIIQVNFKKWNQITVKDCFTFPVNQQCHLTHAVRLDNRKTFLVINFLQLTPEIHYEGIHHLSTPGSTGPTKYCRTFCMLQAQGLTSQDMKIQTEAQFQCRHLQEGRRPWVIYGGYSAEFHGWTVKAANIQIAILPYTTFLCWIIRFKNEATTCSGFSIGNYVLDQRSGDGLFIGRIEISAISLWKGSSKLGDAGREDCLCSEEDHPEFPSRRKSASRSRKPRKRTGFYEETWCDVSMSRCLQICWPGKCWEITSWWKQGSFAWSRKIWTNLWDKNIKNFSNKLMLKDWNWRTHNTEILSLEENNLACEKNHRWRKRLVLRDTQIRSARENHETPQKLTSRLQEMQEQMNSLP